MVAEVMRLLSEVGCDSVGGSEMAAEVLRGEFEAAVS